MTKFVLDKNEIVVSPEREIYNTIRRKYQAFAETASSQFSESFANNFKNIDDVHEKCTDVLMGFLRPVAEEAIHDLIAHKIFDVDVSELEEYFSPYFYWNDDFSEIDEQYMAIVLKAEELDAYRTERRENRGKWIGGGFGIGGAVQGAMQAGAANMVGAALHGSFNILAKGMSAVGDGMKKNALYTDPATKAHLTNAVYRAVFNIHYALVVVLNEKKEVCIGGDVTDEAAAKAKRSLENVVKGRIPTDSVKPLLIEILTLNPYGDDLYKYWLQEYGDKNGELETIEHFFGVSVARKVKKDLMCARRSTLDLSTPEACKISLVQLEAYAVSIGYREFADEKSEILDLAERLDRERRTVEGREYPTLADANIEHERIRLEIVRKDNTVTTSGLDLAKIAFGLLCLVIGAVNIQRNGFLQWRTVAALSLLIAAFQSVRSIRAMKFARGVGYSIAAAGSLAAAIEIGNILNAQDALKLSNLFGNFAITGSGWIIHEIIRKRYEEAGHKVPKSYFLHSVIIGLLLGVALYGASTLFGKLTGLKSDSTARIESPTQPISIAPTTPTATARLAPPTSPEVFADLYGITSQKGTKVTLPSGEEASIWYTSQLSTESGARFLVMVARTHPEQTSYADGGKIDAISYREEAGRWKADAKVKELFSNGAFGSASSLTKEDLAKVENHTLKPGLTGVFLPGGSAHQGYSTDVFYVVGVGNGAIKFLGTVEVGGGNSGACDNSVKDGSGACYDWKGKVQVEPSRNGQPGNILIKPTGTVNIDSRIVPVPVFRYVWENDKEYIAHKE